MRTANSVSFNVACMVHATRADEDAPQERRSPNDATTLLSDVVCVFCGGRGGPRQLSNMLRADDVNRSTLAP